MDSSANFTWRTVETDGPADMIGRHGTLRGPTIRNASNKNVSAAQRPKIVGGIAVCQLRLVKVICHLMCELFLFWTWKFFWGFRHSLEVLP